MPKVLIATGGTGGHLFPAQQLAKELNLCEVLFAGHGLKSSSFFDKSFAYKEIQSASSKKKVGTLLKGVFQSFKEIFLFSPDIVVGFGSFHTFPVLLAAFLLRKKIVLFEPNASLGKVNAFFSFCAHKIAFQFPVKHKKAVYVPLLPWKDLPSRKERLSKKRTILVFGGSQGALFLNQIVPEAVKLLQFEFEIIHLTGKHPLKVEYQVPSLVKEFEKEMSLLYTQADFVICRAGASTIAELLRYQLPAIVIPYPYAYSHQQENAKVLGSSIKVLDQKSLSAQKLAEEMEELSQNLESYERAFKTITLPKTESFSAMIMRET